MLSYENSWSINSYLALTMPAIRSKLIVQALNNWLFVYLVVSKMLSL